MPVMKLARPERVELLVQLELLLVVERLSEQSASLWVCPLLPGRSLLLLSVPERSL